jgi:hypothetical protein
MTPRKISDIQAQILAEKAAQSSLSGLNSTSQTAIYNLWAYIVAVAISLLENIVAIFQVEIEDTASKAAVGSDVWLKSKVLEFQYDAVNPQVLTLVNFAPQYPVINTDLRIISRCSVKTIGSKIAVVKVATGEPPVALSAPQLSSLQSYLTNGGDGTYLGRGVGLGFAGVQINTSSLTSDKFYFKANIYYNGQYSAVIQSTVVAAINNYLANIDFDGNVKLISLVDYIQNVPGVVDITLEDVAMRANATAFGSKTYLVQAFTEIYSTYPTFAGYIVGETTVSNTLNDTITYIAI